MNTCRPLAFKGFGLQAHRALKFLPAAAVAGLLALLPGTAGAGVIISGGGVSDPLEVEFTDMIEFTTPVALSDTQLVYFVFKDVYATDNVGITQVDFSSTSSLTASGGTATFSPFSLDTIDFTIGVVGPRDFNFHFITSGSVAIGETLTFSVGSLLADLADAGIRVPDNLGSTVEIIFTTNESTFANLDSVNVAVVPEPTGGALLALGGLILLARRQRRVQG